MTAVAPAPTAHRADWRLRALLATGIMLAIAAIAWGEVVTTSALSAAGLDVSSRVGTAVHFFLFEVVKITALISLIVFAVGVLATWLTPDRVQRVLARLPRGVGNIVAAGVGVATPFCSCSAVPLFIGLTRAGVPLGVSMSFLVASPMVNEIALGVLAGMAGWKIAALYLGVGLTIAVTTGLIMGAIFDAPRTPAPRLLGLAMPPAKPTLDDRLRAGLAELRKILKQMWPWILGALAVGAAVHGWVPADALQSVGSSWWGVLAAVAIGVPLYSGAASALPLIAPLHAAGVPLGTLLAFLMSVVALSLPEMLLLRKAMKPRVLFTFVAVVAASIVAVGYLMNALT